MPINQCKLYATQDIVDLFCLVFKEIMEDIENDDIEQFTNHVADFDRLLKLDPWKTSMLLRIKNKLDEEPSLA
jgi:alpha-soluble NSF attachment protein